MIGTDIETLLAANDSALEPLLRADPGEVERQIESLIVGVAAPLVERIVAGHAGPRSALAAHDADDVASTVHLRLLDKLRRVRSSPDEGIQNLEKYVAALAYNAINDYLRRRFPERSRLKNRLRYILTHDDRFALWNSSAGLACGLRRWSGAAQARSAVSVDPSGAMLDHRNQPDALQAFFLAAGAPVVFEAVVAFAAQAWHVVDLAAVEATDAADRAELAPARMERRQLMQSLWREIGQLRPMQRKALLLNLRDGESGSVISLLALTGVAAFDDIAAALEMSPEELSEIWNDLPLEDSRIGVLLSVTRQQVINLRKAARARLHRRLFGEERGKN